MVTFSSRPSLPAVQLSTRFHAVLLGARLQKMKRKRKPKSFHRDAAELYQNLCPMLSRQLASRLLRLPFCFCFWLECEKNGGRAYLACLLSQGPPMKDCLDAVYFHTDKLSCKFCHTIRNRDDHKIRFRAKTVASKRLLGAAILQSRSPWKTKKNTKALLNRYYTRQSETIYICNVCRKSVKIPIIPVYVPRKSKGEKWKRKPLQHLIDDIISGAEKANYCKRKFRIEKPKPHREKKVAEVLPIVMPLPNANANSLELRKQSLLRFFENIKQDEDLVTEDERIGNEAVSCNAKRHAEIEMGFDVSEEKPGNNETVLAKSITKRFVFPNNTNNERDDGKPAKRKLKNKLGKKLPLTKKLLRKGVNTNTDVEAAEKEIRKVDSKSKKKKKTTVLDKIIKKKSRLKTKTKTNVEMENLPGNASVESEKDNSPAKMVKYEENTDIDRLRMQTKSSIANTLPGHNKNKMRKEKTKKKGMSNILEKFSSKKSAVKKGSTSQLNSFLKSVF